MHQTTQDTQCVAQGVPRHESARAVLRLRESTLSLL
jgi:hypothetical protein